jgi:hypothetical protein
MMAPQGKINGVTGLPNGYEVTVFGKPVVKGCQEWIGG